MKPSINTSMMARLSKRLQAHSWNEEVPRLNVHYFWNRWKSERC